jgi:DNA-binding CsgD family transcriptional regulator
MDLNSTIKLVNLHEEQIADTGLDFSDKNVQIRYLQQQIAQLNAELAHYQELLKIFNLDLVTVSDDQESMVVRKSESFLKKLQYAFPELSSNDLRICSLLRENFSTKEIANRLGVSPDSANKARYRIRKKLNLKRTQSLVSFILSI